MPTYAYRCKKGHTFELFHSIRDESSKRCPRCGSRARRVPAGGAGLLFKGSGFYITDYRSKSYQEKARKEKSSAGPEKSGGAAPPASSGAGGEKSGGAPAPRSGAGGAGEGAKKPRGDSPKRSSRR